MKLNKNLLLAIVLNLAMLSTNRMKKLESKFFNESISYSDLNNDEKIFSKSKFYILIQYKNDFICEHNYIDSKDESIKHNEEMSKYYYNINLKRHKKIKLKKYRNLVISEFGPFIEYQYDNKELLLKDVDKLKKSPDNNHIEKVYWGEIEYYDNAYRNSSSYSTQYLFSQALLDVGIPVDYYYKGNGIKIASIEMGVPNNYSNLVGKTYSLHGNNLSSTSHSFETSSIYAGTSGIAKNAQLFFTSLSNYSMLECLQWATQNNVDIINMSVGDRTGQYNSTSALIDYVVNNTNTTVVASSGNVEPYYEDRYSNSFGNGANVISVGAVGYNHGLYSESGAGVQYDNIQNMIKPNVVAPGLNITGISNVSSQLSGTSYSAPFVTGIIALLMEEFPLLRTNPELVSSIIMTSGQYVLNQYNIVDYDAGFGLVNYSKAREIYSNSNTYRLNSVSPSGTIFYTKNLSIPYNSTIKIVTNVMYNSNNASGEGNTNAANINYTKVGFRLKNVDTNSITNYYGRSNISYLEFKNQSASSSYILEVYVVDNKNESTIERVAISYDLHVHSYTYAQYSSTQHHYSCSCGISGYADHVWETTSAMAQFNDNGDDLQYIPLYICTVCGYQTTRPPMGI